MGKVGQKPDSNWLHARPHLERRTYNMFSRLFRVGEWPAGAFKPTTVMYTPSSPKLMPQSALPRSQIPADTWAPWAWLASFYQLASDFSELSSNYNQNPQARTVGRQSCYAVMEQIFVTTLLLLDSWGIAFQPYGLIRPETSEDPYAQP